jgi:hypothetical protein
VREEDVGAGAEPRVLAAADRETCLLERVGAQQLAVVLLAVAVEVTRTAAAPHSLAASITSSQSGREASGAPGVRMGSYFPPPMYGVKRRMTSAARG